MALPKVQFGGSNIQAASVAPMLQALQNVGGLITDEQKLIAAEKVRQDTLTQRALDNTRADARLGIAKAQELSRKQRITDVKAQDKAMAEIFSSIDQSKLIPGAIQGVTAGNLEQFNADTAYDSKLDADRVVLQDAFKDEQGREYSPSAVRSNEPRAGMGGQPTTLTGTQVRASRDSETGELVYTDKNGEVVPNYEVRPPSYVNKYGREVIRTYEPHGGSPIAPVNPIVDQEAFATNQKNSLEAITKAIDNLGTKRNTKYTKASKGVRGKSTPRATTGAEKLAQAQQLIMSNPDLNAQNRVALLEKASKLFPETAKTKEALRRAGKVFDMTSEAAIRSRYGIETANAITKFASQFNKDSSKLAKFHAAQKTQIANDYAIIKHGNEFGNDNDSLEWAQAHARLKGLGLNPEDKTFLYGN